MVLLAVILAILQLVSFSRTWANFPPGLTIANIPVGNLSRAEASQRLLEVYSLPVELHYGEAVIQLSPTTVGFTLDMEAMLAAADMERTRQPFWEAFWDYLWERPTTSANIPLSSSYSEERLRTYLAGEVASRYDRPPTTSMPIAGTVNFEAGEQGTEMDIDRSVLLIETALQSTTSRTVALPLLRTSPSRPTFQNLDVLLRQTINISGFDGIIGVYVLDLQTGQDIRLTLSQGQPLAYPPDVSFTGSSTIKIPVMVSVFRRLGENPDAVTTQNLEDMIARSINTATDWLIQKVVDPINGPLRVTEDMQALGLTNTFLAGFFYQGAPLLQAYSTPGNQRTDVITEPDRYNQTTPTEIGTLLQDIYLCAQIGGGALVAAFPGEITQAECQSMISYLTRDKIALLIEAGVPDGTNVAHKHGWVTDPYGIIHDMSDAAIVFTPGGDYVLSVYLYHPTQIVFEPANNLVKDLSRAVYNYYNTSTP